MKRLALFFLLLLVMCCFSYGKSTDSNNDSISIKYQEISNLVSLDLFEKIKTFILNKGDRETYCNMYGNNPHYSFSEFDGYLNPEIGQRNINCDTSKSGFNEIVLRDWKANPQYYTIHIVRKGDLANTLIHTWEGMSEEKVFLLNLYNENIDSLVNNVSFYLDKVKKEIAGNSIINRNSSDEKFSIYPTIVRNKLLVHCNHENTSVIEIDISNIQGFILLNRSFNVNGQVDQPVDVSSLQPGFYMCRMKAEGKTRLFKFIKR